MNGHNVLCIGWLLTYRAEKLLVFIAENREWYFDLTSGKEIERDEAARRLAGRDRSRPSGGKSR